MATKTVRGQAKRDLLCRTRIHGEIHPLCQCQIDTSIDSASQEWVLSHSFSQKSAEKCGARMRGSCARPGPRAKRELRARIGVRAESRSATIILMSTVSQIATEFATVSAMPTMSPTVSSTAMSQSAKPAPVEYPNARSHGSQPDSAWASSAWKQLVARDPQARFFYGVATTGVFCRPACASRQPLRANVRFFRTAAEAKAAGFR